MPSPESGPSPEEMGIAPKEQTVEDLQRTIRELQAKVEAATAQQQVDVTKAVADRETLIGESKKNEDLLAEAQKGLAYFDSLPPAALAGVAAEQQNFKDLVASLEVKRDEIDQRIAAISGQPEVNKKLVDMAEEEGKGRELSKEAAEFQEQFKTRIDALADNIIELASKHRATLTERNSKAHEAGAARGVIRELLTNALQQAKSGTELVSLLRDADISNTSKLLTEFLPQLEQIRAKLGFLASKKDKGAADTVLAEKDGAFKTLQTRETEFEAADQAYKGMDTAIGELHRQYWALNEEGRQADEKFGRESQFAYLVDRQLRERTEADGVKNDDLDFMSKSVRNG